MTHKKEVFEQRVVALYEAGDTQYIDIILKAKVITDFISSYYVLSEIADYDSEMLQEIGERKHNIENTKEKLEKEKIRSSNNNRKTNKNIKKYYNQQKH